MGTASVPWGVGPRDQEEFSPVLERAGEPMARRTFDVVDVTEILIHWYAGRLISEVSTSLAVDRKTIRKYVGPAAAAGRRHRWAGQGACRCCAALVGRVCA